MMKVQCVNLYSIAQMDNAIFVLKKLTQKKIEEMFFT